MFGVLTRQQSTDDGNQHRQSDGHQLERALLRTRSSVALFPNGKRLERKIKPRNVELSRAKAYPDDVFERFFEVGTVVWCLHRGENRGQRSTVRFLAGEGSIDGGEHGGQHGRHAVQVVHTAGVGNAKV